MSRRLLFIAAAAAFLGTGPACRMCHRDECSARRSAPPGCDAVPVSLKRSPGGFTTIPSGGIPPVSYDGMVGGDAFPAVPTSFGMPTSYGGPSYPVGEPVPLRPTAAAPANELPYPAIPNPGVPEAAVPGAASPPSARTTGDQRFVR